MIEHLKETIKLLLESNKAIAEQLLLVNEKYSCMLEELNGLAENYGNEIDSIAINEKTGQSPVPVTGNDDETNEENVCELAGMDEENADINEEDDSNKSNDAVTDRDSETENYAIEPVEDENETLYIHDEKLNVLNTPIKEAIDSLSDNVYDCCNDSEQIYQSVEELTSSYREFIKSVRNKCIDDKEEIQDILVKHLSEYGWANIISRLYAYSKVDSFKYNYLKTTLSGLYELVTDMYADFGIEIELPYLLEDEYENAKYIYNNESNILIEYFCDLSPAEHINKVYDIIQVGYKKTLPSGNDDIHKPVIFYYS